MRKIKNFFITLVLFSVLPCYALNQITDMGTFILFDINNDGKKEIITEINKRIVAYQYESNKLIELGKTSLIGTVENFFESDKELYIISNKILYQCLLKNNNLTLVKINDLSLMLDYAYKIYRDSKALNIIGKKTLGSSKVEVSLTRLSDNNKTTKFQLQEFDHIYAMNVIINNGEVNILVINGVEESIQGLTIYKINNNKLNIVKKINIPMNTFTSATFIAKGNRLYVSGWFGDVETDDAFPGIFEYNLTNGKVETILKVESQPYWFDIGDINGDGKLDIVWTDQDGLHIELSYS